MINGSKTSRYDQAQFQLASQSELPLNLVTSAVQLGLDLKLNTKISLNHPHHQPTHHPPPKTFSSLLGDWWD